MEYLDVKVGIGNGTNGVYPITIEGPRRNGLVFRQKYPFDEEEHQRLFQSLRNIIQPTSKDIRAIREFGERIFQFALDNRVYHVTYEEARKAGKGVRILLSLTAPELEILPWEYMCDPNLSGAFLGVMQETVIIRSPMVPQRIDKLTVALPLNILAMAVCPKDSGNLNVEDEKADILRAVQPLVAQKLLTLQWVEGQTVEALRLALSAHNNWHVFHFIGHGAFDEQEETGFLAFANEDGTLLPYDALHLAALLNKHKKTLRLVIMNACESGKGNDRDLFSSAAAKLIQQGIPSVLAMQREVSDGAAITLSQGFYDALVRQQLPVDAAVNEARNQIYTKHERTLEWGTPSIYLRAENGRLFTWRKRSRTPSQSRPKLKYVPFEHRYTLMQTLDIIGRRQELAQLNDWVGDPLSPNYGKPVFVIRAWGGTGKSAIVWNWFDKIEDLDLVQPFVGHLWWNFYKDANFDHFVRNALSYVARLPEEEIRLWNLKNCIERLFEILNEQPYLFVLDGFESLLKAYTHSHSGAGDENETVDATGSTRVELNADERLVSRQTDDPLADLFLQRLLQLRESRVLIVTRLTPNVLETQRDSPHPLCATMNLEGLTEEDARALCQALKVKPTDRLLEFLREFRYHPLFIQVIAGAVNQFRPAPGNFDAWYASNINFDVARLPLARGRRKIWEIAIGQLDTASLHTLETIAALHTPCRYDTLNAILVGNDDFSLSKMLLHDTLSQLEDHGLLGWDRNHNYYEMHPIIRSVALAQLNAEPAIKELLYRAIYNYFDTFSVSQPINNWLNLVPPIEMYNAKIQLGEQERAVLIFRQQLEKSLISDLCENYRAIELLRQLFTLNKRHDVPITFNIELAENLDLSPLDSAYVLLTLGNAYHLSVQPGRAVDLYKEAQHLYDKHLQDLLLTRELEELERTRVLLADALHATGRLYESEQVTGMLARDPRTHIYSRAWIWIQFLLMTRGRTQEVEQRFLKRLESRPWKWNNEQPSPNNIALGWLRLHDFPHALKLAELAERQARSRNQQRDQIRAMRIQGAVFLHNRNLSKAEKLLEEARLRASQANYAEVELSAMIDLAELARRKGDYAQARTYLNRVWNPAEIGPFRLLLADAFNVLAQIERDQGQLVQARDAARRAFTYSWCDGPPYIYHRGLEEAKAHLHALGEDVAALERALDVNPRHHEDMSLYRELRARLPTDLI